MIGINAQLGVDCEKVSGTIGHSGLTFEAQVAVAEGTWIEISETAPFEMIAPGPITEDFKVELPL